MFERFKQKQKYATIKIRPVEEENKTEKTTIKGPEGCQHCGQIYSTAQLKREYFVCPGCEFHFPVSASDRIEQIIDEGTFIEFDETMTSADPLQFPDYKEKLSSDQKKTNLKDAIITGKGKIKGHYAIIGVMDSRFRMGSMGSVVGEKIARAIEKSLEEKIPFILFAASGGARMQEGILSLMQMAKTGVALEKLNQEGILFISVMTNPTTGGVSASFASLGDINIAEPKALIGFAGRRIIEQTIREELPKEFQTAEFLLEHGQLDKIVNRKDMKTFLGTVLKIHQ